MNAALHKVAFGKTAFFAWKNEDPDFSDAVEAVLNLARQSVAAEAEQGLRDLIAERHPTAIIFALKTLIPDVYGDKTKVQHTGTVKHAHTNLSVLTDEEIDSLAAIADRVHGRV